MKMVATYLVFVGRVAVLSGFPYFDEAALVHQTNDDINLLN